MTALEVLGACPHDCPDTCSMRVHVERGRAVSVRGDSEHATTQGFLCAKVNRYLDRTYSPDRILQPMLREGAKGEGRFRTTTWDEALDVVVHGLKRVSRPEAILPYSYSGTLGLVQSESMDRRFFHRLGASQLDRTICSTCGSETLDAVLGRREGVDLSSFERSKLVLLWGTNTLTSNTHLWPILRKGEARLIAIDPVRTRTAERCDGWIPIRPGTDAALAYGMMKVIRQAGLEDRDYLDHHTVGAEQLRRRVDGWTVDRAVTLSGVPAETIEALALEFARTRPAAIRMNYGMQRHAGGGAAVHALLCLATMVGAWREPGGGAALSTSGAYPTNPDALGRPDLMPNPRPRVINMSQLGDALAGDVEALFVYGSNPAAVAPDQERVLAGLARDDLFTVVHELFMTDTARYADVLLPATSQLEQLDIHKSYGHLDVLLNTPSIAPLGESVSNTELFRRLAQRMGFDEPCFRDDDETLARAAFRWEHPRMRGITLETLRQGPQRLRVPEAYAPFASPDRPLDLRRGDDGWVPPAEVGRADSLALISAPAHHFLNSTFANLPFARARTGKPSLRMHPDDATSRALKDGDVVRIHNARGAFEAVLQVTDGIVPGTVSAPSIYWNDDTRTGRNANAVTSQRLTDVGRAATFYDCAVDVSPAHP